MEITIPTPRNFSFQRTVISHGWCELLPFSLDQATWELTRVIALGEKPPVTITMRSGKGHVSATTSRRLNKTEAARVLRDARHILRLDDDLSPFYLATGSDPEFAWIGKQGAGRMLRSLTVFEDPVKMICTTNCSCTLTKDMVTAMVQKVGLDSYDRE